MDVVIYDNPGCGTSRNTLGLIRQAGNEPRVIEYVKTPPTRAELADLIGRMGVSVRDVLRDKGRLSASWDSATDEQLIDAMMEHPVLINRPIVVTPLGVKLCRPSEAMLDILPALQQTK
jgi:arsenate reductase (glutaredoxin)